MTRIKVKRLIWDEYNLEHIKKGEKYMRKKKFKFPDFDKMTYKEEAEWWDTHDLGEYWDELEDVDIVWELEKQKDETVVVRLQKDIKDRLEAVAKSKGLNLSALARMWLIEKLQSFKP